VPVGDDVAGHLRLRTDSLPAASDLSRVIGTADVVAELIGRLATAERRLESRGRKVTTLMELGRAIPQTSTLTATLDKLLLAATELTGYWSAAFFLADPLALTFRLRQAHGLPASGVPVPQRIWSLSPDSAAMEQGVIVLQRGDAEAEPWLPASCAVGFAVPVSSSAGPLGTLWCYDRRHRTVATSDVQALQSVAAQTATVLERTVWLHETAAQKRLRDELHVASRRHPGHAFGPVPRDWGLDIAVKTASAAELGGDLCELWPVGPRRLLVAIGDAVGHSVPAAMIMAVARGSLRTQIASRDGQPLEVDRFVQRLNEALCTVTRGEQFMTLFCCMVDLNDGSLTATNAGHPPPWLIRGGEPMALGAHGLLLGILPETAYESVRLPLQAGDCLVFFTDGVSEAMSRTRELFGAQGVVQTLRGANWTTAEQAAEAIWAALQQHTSGLRASDDQTLLVIRVADAPAALSSC
jgi:sigma-B regulation protein RsbU (phosphoserine phosphatase)